jgi:hypothetical protein
MPNLRRLWECPHVNEVWQWFDTDKAAVVVAVIALLGVVYTAAQARAAKDQAATSKKAATAAEIQARLAETQVEFTRQQTDLLLRQVQQGELAAAETRRAQQDALQPVVTVDIGPGVNDPSVFVLTIANIGPSIARDVRIKGPAEMVRHDGTKMHEWSVFTSGIKTMPPGYKIHFFFDVGFRRFDGPLPKDFTFVVDCEGPFGPTPQVSYEIDLSSFAGVWAAPTTLGSVVQQLERTNQAMDKLREAVRMLDPEYRAWTRRGFEDVDPETELRRI